MLDVELVDRNFKFDFRECQKKYWFDNNPVKTLYANTITLSIPYGERFIVQSVRPLVTQIKDKAFRKKIWQFAKQEENHSREHMRLCRHLVRPFYPELKLSKRLFYKMSKCFAFLTGKKIHLATISAIEHFTAVTSEIYLAEPELLGGLDERFRFLWLWHFLEEVEHRAVAFDILKHIQCGYFTRALGFFLGGLFVLSSLFGPFIYMAIKDKLYRSWSFYKEMYYFFWRREGVIKKAIVPFFRYLMPYYHPNRYTKVGLIEEYRAKILEFSPAVGRPI